MTERFDFAPLTPEWAERRRRRLLAKRAQRMPLFEAAGVADEVMPVGDTEAVLAQGQALLDRYEKQLKDTALLLAQREADFRAQVAALVPPDRVAAMDAYRLRVYPADPAYGAEFWRKKLCLLSGRCRVLLG